MGEKWTVTKWNSLIDEVQALMELAPDNGCLPVQSSLPSKVEDDPDSDPPRTGDNKDHRWNKSEIESVQNVLKEICPDNEFTQEDKWKQRTVDQIRSAIATGWCRCGACDDPGNVDANRAVNGTVLPLKESIPRGWIQSDEDYDDGEHIFCGAGVTAVRNSEWTFDIASYIGMHVAPAGFVDGTRFARLCVKVGERYFGFGSYNIDCAGNLSSYGPTSHLADAIQKNVRTFFPCISGMEEGQPSAIFGYETISPPLSTTCASIVEFPKVAWAFGGGYTNSDCSSFPPDVRAAQITEYETQFNNIGTSDLSMVIILVTSQGECDSDCDGIPDYAEEPTP